MNEIDKDIEERLQRMVLDKNPHQEVKKLRNLILRLENEFTEKTNNYNKIKKEYLDYSQWSNNEIKKLKELLNQGVVNYGDLPESIEIDYNNSGYRWFYDSGMSEEEIEDFYEECWLKLIDGVLNGKIMSLDNDG